MLEWVNGISEISFGRVQLGDRSGTTYGANIRGEQNPDGISSMYLILVSDLKDSEVI